MKNIKIGMDVITKNGTIGKVVAFLTKKRIEIELHDENGMPIFRTPYIAWCESI